MTRQVHAGKVQAHGATAHWCAAIMHPPMHRMPPVCCSLGGLGSRGCRRRLRCRRLLLGGAVDTEPVTLGHALERRLAAGKVAGVVA